MHFTLSHDAYEELAQLMLELDAGGDDRVKLRSTYTGRGMGDRTCLALVGGTTDVVVFATLVARLDADVEYDDEDVRVWPNLLLQAIQGGTRVDSMGFDRVYYWPQVTVATEE